MLEARHWPHEVFVAVRPQAGEFKCVLVPLEQCNATDRRMSKEEEHVFLADLQQNLPNATDVLPAPAEATKAAAAAAAAAKAKQPSPVPAKPDPPPPMDRPPPSGGNPPPPSTDTTASYGLRDC